MDRFFIDYLNRLQQMHNELRATLEGLSQVALDWTPAEGANSLAVIVFHTAGAERYLIGDCVAGEPSGRDREAEFRTGGLNADALQARLDASLSYAGQVLERLTLNDLETLRPWPRDNSQVTVGWLLAHLLSHTAIHAGHAQVTRQWWEQSNNG
jgi:uncharacterized damage-inducible protein DinB